MATESLWSAAAKRDGPGAGNGLRETATTAPRKEIPSRNLGTDSARLRSPPSIFSWRIPADRFFALVGERGIRRGTFHRAVELEQAIWKWLTARNGSLSPFIGKASADVTLGKVRRCHEWNRAEG